MTASQPYEMQTQFGTIVGPGEDDLICRFLSEYGEWAPFESRLAFQFISPGMTILDAGAYLGTFGLEIAHSHPDIGKLIAVEANPRTIPFLSTNLSSTCRVPFEIVDAALGTDQDFVDLKTNTSNHGSTHLSLHDGEVADVLRVPATTLPRIREQHGDYDFAKLDLEGAELRTLKSDQAFLHQKKPTLFVEANEDKQTVQVANYMRWLGYRVQYAALPAYRMRNFKNSTQRLYAIAFEGLLIASNRDGTGVEADQELHREGGFLIDINNPQDLIEGLWYTPRWGAKDWVGLSRTQLYAELGRSKKGESRIVFNSKMSPETPFGDNT